MKTQFLIAGFCIMLLISCRHTTTSNHQDDHNTTAVSVMLDDGQKWNANKETTDGIHNMILLVSTLPTYPNHEDFHTLKRNLETEFDTILKKCTMQGEAHQQLHHYLLPLREIIEQLGSNTLEKQKAALGDLKQYLKEYPAYFN